MKPVKQKKKYVSKRIEFYYPDLLGKTELLGFTMIVEEAEQPVFDKYMNIFISLAKASGLVDIPIHDWTETSTAERSSKPKKLVD